LLVKKELYKQKLLDEATKKNNLDIS